jgi:parallel beta helix pectate lyase-like protein
MKRASLLWLLLAGCGGTESYSGSALAVHVQLQAPLDPADVRGFRIVASRAGGFPAFDPREILSADGSYTLSTDGDGEIVLTWPNGAVYQSEFSVLFEFATAQAFACVLSAAATDGTTVFARGQAPCDVPERGVSDVDLPVSCIVPDCSPPRALGQSCTDGVQCQSGFCADHVCCESACDGACESCGSDGSCTPTSGGDPDGDCNAGDTTCAGVCNGAGGCDYPNAGAVCATCRTCGAAGTCDATPADTDPNDDCDPCEVCDGAGMCRFVASGDPKLDCTGDAGCEGACDGSGGCAYPSATACGAASCVGNAIAIPECNGLGSCAADPSPDDCGVYLCVAPSCPATCQSDADCIATAVCDLRDGTCVAASTVLCGAAGGGELQTAIDNCLSPRCYFRITGTCDAITVSDKDVYIDGLGTATINGAGSTPVVASEVGTEVRVALVGTTITGASGALPGINATSSDGPADPVEVWALAGTRVEGNSGAGMNVTNAALVVEEATITGNDGSGILATDSTLELRRSTVDSNGFGSDAPGISLVINSSSSSFIIENSIIVWNGSISGVGISAFATAAPLAAVFRYNTVADNAGGGMNCASPQAATAVEWSLFLNGANELAGSCTSSASDVPGFDDACGNGMGQADPGFYDRMPPVLNYHLSGSPPDCIDAIACSAAVTEDVDGDPRAGACTVGADEP